MKYKPRTLMKELCNDIAKEEAALFYFSTPTCNVCKVLKPKIAELIESEFPKIKLFYIDLDKAPVISGQFRIFSIPTILVYFNGKEFIRKSRNIGMQELENELKRPYQLMFDN